MKLSLQHFLGIILLLPLTVFSQIPSGMEGMISQHKEDQLPKEYKVLKSKSAIGAGVQGMPSNTPKPFLEAYQSGKACILVMKEEYEDYCPDHTNFTAELTAWVMYLDEGNPFNSFSVHPGTKKATLRLQGTMDKYVPGPNYCLNNEMVKAETGIGTMVADFNTYLQTSPRTFQVVEQGPPDSKQMEDLKELRAFWRKNIIAYLKYVKEYQYKPHIRIGGNGNNPPPPPNQKPPIKHGTEDEGDGEDDGWSSTRDGFGYAKTAIDAFTTATDYVDLASKGAKLYGAVAQFKKGVAKAALDFVGSAASAAGYDASSMSEDQIYATTDMMIAALAEVNKNYAANGNASAQQNVNKSRLPVKDERYHKEGLDAGYLLYQMNDLFNQLDEVEEELDKFNFPKSAVRGSIQGPGLYQNLASLKQEGSPMTMIATSTATQEGMKAASPGNLQQLKDMGYDIPDEIMNMDINAMIDEAQSKLDGKVDMDLRAPLFNGILSTTRTTTLANGTKVQNYQIMFAISSPNEPEDESWWYAASIFDDPAADEDPGKPKEKELYVATDGSDSGIGSENNPFATLQKALDEAKTLQLAQLPVKIIVKDGIYRQSAEVNWAGLTNMAPLTITSENRHAAIFTGTDPVDNITWVRNIDKEKGGWKAPLPLHPQQWTYVPGGSPLDNPAPVLVVNGSRLFHLPVMPPGGYMMYSLGASEIHVGPPQDVSDLNVATVEISTRPYAIKLNGGPSVEITGLKFSNYPHPSPNNSPGVLHSGNASVIGCKFE